MENFQNIHSYTISSRCKVETDTFPIRPSPLSNLHQLVLQLLPLLFVSDGVLLESLHSLAHVLALGCRVLQFTKLVHQSTKINFKTQKNEENLELKFSYATEKFNYPFRRAP